MINDKQLEERMRQAKPKLPVDPAFTARVMGTISEQSLARQPRFAAWRLWSIAGATLIALFVVGLTVMLHRPPHTTIADTETGSSTMSQTPGGGRPTGGAMSVNYQGLADDAQSDIDGIHQQTSSFSDNDYGDTLLSDGALYQ